MNQMTDAEAEVSLLVRNRAGRDLLFILEPWGEEFVISAEAEFLVVGSGPQRGSGLIIDYGPDTIVVTGWTGCVLRLLAGSQELGDARRRPPVPDFD